MNEAPTAQTEPKPAEAPSLEDLYQEYNVQPNSPQPPTAEPKPAPESNAAIQDEIKKFRQELQADRAQKQADAEQKDFNSAVAELAKEADLKGKDSLLKGFLIGKATEDERLRTLWEKRAENPQAWSKALKILAGEVKEAVAVPNPQLEENQRAMDESQRAGTSTAPVPPKPGDDVMRMNEAEFAQYWARLARRG